MTVLLTPFQFGCLLFLLFVWLLWLGLTVLHWIRDKSRHPCLVPDLKRNAYSFCLLSMMLAIGFSYMALIMLKYAPSIPTLLSVFIINGCWILANAFSVSIDMIMWFFVFHFVYMMYHITWLVFIVPTLYPWNKTHLIMVYYLFDVLLDSVC